jgi:Raf kinase inhibitor-like YbhB/YbcL family protein
MKELKIKSSAFEHNGSIPRKYTCDGEDVNPPLTIEDIPEGTHSLALIMDDPDAPMGTWDHWVVWNIPPSSKEIRENSVPGVEGMNDFRKHSYGGPCPPGGTHRYFFKVYALNTTLNIGANSRKKDLEKAMQDHILAKGELIGRYSRR